MQVASPGKRGAVDLLHTPHLSYLCVSGDTSSLGNWKWGFICKSAFTLVVNDEVVGFHKYCIVATLHQSV